MDRKQVGAEESGPQIGRNPSGSLDLFRVARCLRFRNTQTDNYFLAFFAVSFLAAARRSVFLRREARFFTLSLPWLFPIRLHSRPSAADTK
jgi:hypothetical protein